MADIVTAVTGYPSTLDTRTTLTDGASGSDQNAIQINGPASAILAIETELGTQPRGTATDVRTRLDRGIASAGTILRTASAWGTTYGDGDIWIGSAASNSMELSRITAGQGITIARGAHSLAISQTTLTAAAATAAEMEAGTSTSAYVSPGRFQAHSSATKAWWYVVLVAGVPRLDGQYNISSITDNAVGNYTVNFTTAFSAASFAWTQSSGRSTSPSIAATVEQSRSTTTLRLSNRDDANAEVEATEFGGAAHGDQ